MMMLSSNCDGVQGNLDVNEHGIATYDAMRNDITLQGDNAVTGRCIIVHSMRDDGVTQPSGMS